MKIEKNKALPVDLYSSFLEKIDFEFPKDYLSIMKKMNGFTVEIKDEGRLFYLFSFEELIEEYSNMEEEMEELIEEGGASFIPIGRDGLGNYYVFKEDEKKLYLVEMSCFGFEEDTFEESVSLSFFLKGNFGLNLL